MPGELCTLDYLVERGSSYLRAAIRDIEGEPGNAAAIKA
jgi:hypothetical protein